MEIEYLWEKVEMFDLLVERFGEETPRQFLEEVFGVPAGEVEVIEQTWRNRYLAEQARLVGRPVRIVYKDGGVVEKTWVHSGEGDAFKIGPKHKSTGYVSLERIASVEVLWRED